ncbi:uncharacterized protein A1O9_06767 [Exophiala aquamarina CBS 119918]|uniref:Cytochrome P450 oxidoreductase n=1 Tax=Exophiala aquamarina CBS 119918 TaxID=1182545 RepID=A0A072PBC6_9EURO|nr:uncharacterized protein A1O9_06767 [Exophiala aquamarina CBS 119918]KEF56578.1 hypothetical protein A1O9_06767 [Exophiala aquamarina CBS 119918]
MTQGIMSGDSRIVLMPYNNRWRALRKIMHNILAGRQQDIFKPFQDLESKQLLWDYLHQPDRWWSANGSVYKRELDRIIERMGAGTQRDCFTTHFIQTPEAEEMDETQKLFTLGSLIEAGSDTSRVTLGQIIAAAAIYPDWVKRAREELDVTCGERAERLPQWEDRDSLPYIKAVVKEGFRWRPNIAEIGAPTTLIKDDEYEGYRFPAGTVFVWNAWAIALSPAEYEDPERFWPERFLNADLDNPLKGHWAFGPGRRVCVGWKVGEMNVWIAIARMLYCFDFKQIPGEVIDSMTIPQLSHDRAPFSVKVQVRSPAHANLIMSDCEAATKAI